MTQPTVLLLCFDSSPLGDRIAEYLYDHFDVVRAGCKDPPEIAAVICVDPRGEGMDRMGEYLDRSRRDAPVLLVAPMGGPQCVPTLLSQGVSDFIVPPISRAELLARLDRLLGGSETERTRLGRSLRQRLGLAQLIGDSDAFRATVAQIPLIARSDATVLIEGETGTGKEVCARAIHYLSGRSAKPFIAVNCAALPLDLIENELFGHVQDAYTGATTTRPGVIHAANGGSLLLDEIDSLPPLAQVKLLRLLQEKEYRALGSNETHSADVRVIAATNCNMVRAVRSGKVREDFYYRLNVLSLALPPLRERQGDIILLAEHFISRFAQRLHVPVPSLSSAAVHRLLGHRWPGNIRELEHVIERSVVLADSSLTIRSKHIQLPLVENATPAESFQEAKALAIAAWERAYIENLLTLHRGNISQAARAVRKHRRAFWELVRKHEIDATRFRGQP